MSEESAVIQARRKKAEEFEAQGVALFPNNFRPTDHAGPLKELFKDYDNERLSAIKEPFRLAGRMMSRRDFGKAIFIHIQDETGRIQVFVKKDELGPENFKLFKKFFDLGDIIGVEGPLFRTKTGELTILAQKVCLVTKAFRPLPEKYHGLQDVELRYRRRYLDLIMNERVR